MTTIRFYRLFEQKRQVITDNELPSVPRIGETVVIRWKNGEAQNYSVREVQYDVEAETLMRAQFSIVHVVLEEL